MVTKQEDKIAVDYDDKDLHKLINSIHLNDSLLQLQGISNLYYEGKRFRKKHITRDSSINKYAYI